MTLNFHTEYALRVVIYLSLYPEEVIPTRVIAEKYGISINHLNKVSQRLATLGIVESIRGKGGGIRLEESTKTMKLGDLTRSIEPQHEIAQCSGGGGLAPCIIGSCCGLRSILAEAQTAFWEHLNNYTVEDLVKDQQNPMKALFGVND